MGLMRAYQVSQMDTMSSSTISVTTAGTSALVASMTSGTMYITDLIIANGAASGSVYFGVGTSAVAPTTSAILIQSVYLGVNTPFGFPGMGTPIKVTSGNNFLVTAVSCTTLSITALYYITP